MRGFGFLIWVILAMLLLAGPYMLLGVRPEFKYILMAIIGLGIYNFYRGFFGDSVLTIGLAGLTFYYLVWRHFWTASFLWWVYTLGGLGIISTIGWTYITVAQIGGSFRRR